MTRPPTSTPVSQPSAPPPEVDIGMPGQTQPQPDRSPQPPAQPEPPTPPEPSRLVIEGCGVVGGYDRVFIFQRDAATGICTDFGLVTPTDQPSAFAVNNLSLPAFWTVEDMSAFECGPDGNAVSDATPTTFMRADGAVSFADMQGSLPLRVKLDVVLSAPAEDRGTPEEQIISEQRRLADDIDLRAGCRLRD